MLITKETVEFYQHAYKSPWYSGYYIKLQIRGLGFESRCTALPGAHPLIRAGRWIVTLHGTPGKGYLSLSTDVALALCPGDQGLDLGASRPHAAAVYEWRWVKMSDCVAAGREPGHENYHSRAGPRRPQPLQQRCILEFIWNSNSRLRNKIML